MATDSPCNWEWSDLAAWVPKIVQPLIDDPPSVQPYEVGSWGPADAAKLCAEQPSWREPWLES